MMSNPTQIDKLEAGPELDALVAEKVMGWTRGWESNREFHPSTEIDSAWEVVEKLAIPQRIKEHKLPLGAFSIEERREGWRAHWSAGEALADTAPLSISRAALKAVLDPG